MPTNKYVTATTNEYLLVALASPTGLFTYRLHIELSIVLLCSISLLLFSVEQSIVLIEASRDGNDLYPATYIANSYLRRDYSIQYGNFMYIDSLYTLYPTYLILSRTIGGIYGFFLFSGCFAL